MPRSSYTKFAYVVVMVDILKSKVKDRIWVQRRHLQVPSQVVVRSISNNGGSDAKGKGTTSCDRQQAQRTLLANHYRSLWNLAIGGFYTLTSFTRTISGCFLHKP